ncbi:hypothetical protein LCGC14_1119960 [marine sediment metagenome]|uniref:Uncharacterized protein n=1 Tax=marine sediment metagenome TaxID=412755 RepID=A0A0F9PMD5_9ZZZZ
MESGIHFHGKLDRLIHRGKHVIIRIWLDKKSLDLIRVKAGGFIEPGSEIEVTITNEKD